MLPLVVANAAEGEPASAKDAALLCHRPHLVLDGLALRGRGGPARPSASCGCTARRTRRTGRSSGALAGTAGQRHGRAAGAAGHRPEPLPVRRVERGGPRAVRRPGAAGVPPRARPPMAGVGGRPTLVQNVETLARVGLLARTGVDGHRPTSLVTVVAGGRRTVLERRPRHAGERCAAAGRLAGRRDAAGRAASAGTAGPGCPGTGRGTCRWTKPPCGARAPRSAPGVLAPLPAADLRGRGGRPARGLPRRPAAPASAARACSAWRAISTRLTALRPGRRPAQRRPPAAALGRRGRRPGRLPPPRRRGPDGAVRAGDLRRRRRGAPPAPAVLGRRRAAASCPVPVERRDRP